jgi:hypothetical protein
MDKEFKQWLETNKLIIVTVSVHNPSSPKYSMLPIVNTVIYNPNTFEPVYVHRMVTKERYDELIRNDDLIYGEGRLLKI